jgi:hypothetical protein
MPYTKPNNVPRYVHNKSNHPPTILKNIPESINKRLSEISSDEESFKKAAAPYQQSINDSGYDYELRYEPPCYKPVQQATKKPYEKNHLVQPPI